MGTQASTVCQLRPCFVKVSLSCGVTISLGSAEGSLGTLAFLITLPMSSRSMISSPPLPPPPPSSSSLEVSYSCNQYNGTACIVNRIHILRLKSQFALLWLKKNTIVHKACTFDYNYRSEFSRSAHQLNISIYEIRIKFICMGK